MRNVLSFWGLGACLLGSHSKRIVLLSGTPYNNGPSDMSALMTFIDPYLESAQLSFWEDATRDGSPKSVIKKGEPNWRVCRDVNALARQLICFN